jgi:hypothetical protein
MEVVGDGYEKFYSVEVDRHRGPPVLLQKAALFNSNLTEDIVFLAVLFIVTAMRTQHMLVYLNDYKHDAQIE